MQGLSLLWFATLLPAVGAIIQMFAGASLGKNPKGKRILGVMAVLPIVAAFGIAATITANMDSKAAVIHTLGSWIKLPGLDIPFELRVDSLSMTMMLIITGIGALIHIYATGYMAEEKDYARFFAYLNLFISSMLILVLGNNLLLLFVGWEGVGLCSYLLIGFWYKDLANSRAANKAFIVNRIGDWGLTLGLLMLIAFVASGTGILTPANDKLLSYDTILPILEFRCAEEPGIALAIALLLFVGACGKSAQFPLYTWLPDAMAGPTPVSALIHAATMVTSGVVLLNRMHVVFEASPVASAVICMVGAFTALFAALIAFGQTDIKKVLAYSTVSQLGFMFVACGAGAYWVGIFHVTTHAFFKALLFLGSGAVIHAMAHEQDMRHYGNLRKYIKITFITMMIGYLAISGVPLLSGFYSKEAVIGAALANDHAMVGEFNASAVAGLICLLTAALTAMYMTRMMWLTFFGGSERWRAIEVHSLEVDDHHHLDGHHTPKEVPPSMWIPLVVLAALSLGGGFLLNQGNAFRNFLASSTVGVRGQADLHPVGIPLMALSIGAAVVGILTGIFIYRKGLPKKEGLDESAWAPSRLLMRDQFGYDNLVTSASIDGGRELANVLEGNLDKGLFDGSGQAIRSSSQWFADTLRSLQNGAARLYALGMLAGVLALVAIASLIVRLLP